MWGIIIVIAIVLFFIRPKKNKTSSPAKPVAPKIEISEQNKNSTQKEPEEPDLLSQNENEIPSPIEPEPESIEIPEQEDSSTQNGQTELDLHNAYQKKWLFSYNEKDAFWKLKKIAEEKGYLVFAKVRLIDLVEPTKGNPKYKTFFYKVQAKHVDFVLCDQKLVARIVIELDDSSHKKEDRAERDNFVDTILRNTGYKVIRVMAISENILDEIERR